MAGELPISLEQADHDVGRVAKIDLAVLVVVGQVGDQRNRERLRLAVEALEGPLHVGLECVGRRALFAIADGVHVIDDLAAGRQRGVVVVGHRREVELRVTITVAIAIATIAITVAARVSVTVALVVAAGVARRSARLGVGGAIVVATAGAEEGSQGADTSGHA